MHLDSEGLNFMHGVVFEVRLGLRGDVCMLVEDCGAYNELIVYFEYCPTIFGLYSPLTTRSSPFGIAHGLRPAVLTPRPCFRPCTRL
jgi:hypothetical protein